MSRHIVLVPNIKPRVVIGGAEIVPVIAREQVRQFTLRGDRPKVVIGGAEIVPAIARARR